MTIVFFKSQWVNQWCPAYVWPQCTGLMFSVWMCDWHAWTLKWKGCHSDSFGVTGYNGYITANDDKVVWVTTIFSLCVIWFVDLKCKSGENFPQWILCESKRYGGNVYMSVQVYCPGVRLMPQHKTAVTPSLSHWSYRGLALNLWDFCVYVWRYVWACWPDMCLCVSV